MAEHRDDEGPSPWAANRQSAFGLLATEIAHRQNGRRYSKEKGYEVGRSKSPITLPTDVWRLIRDCASATGQQDAFEQLETALKQVEGEPWVTLPFETAHRIWRDIRESGKGLYKGQGRRKPKLSHGDKLRRKAIAADGLQRQEEIRAERKAATKKKYDLNPEDQGAKEANKLAHERYSENLSDNYVRKMMRELRPKTRTDEI